MPRLSILIPWLGSPHEFEASLASVLQNRPADCEVVLAHVPPYDDPYALRDEVRLIHAPEQTTVAGLINAVLPALHGEIVHLLGCGSEVQEHWTEPALAHFHDAEVAAVSPLVIRSDERIAAAGVALTADGRKQLVGAGLSWTAEKASQFDVAGPSLLGGFFHRDVLQALGGFDEQMGDALADLDLALAVDDLGLRCVFEPALPMRTSETPHAHRSGVIGGGRESERFYRRYHSRCSAVGKLVWRPIAVVGDSLLRLPRLVGRTLAWLENDPAEQHAIRVQAAAEMLEQAAAGATLSITAVRDRRDQAAPQSHRRAA